MQGRLSPLIDNKIQAFPHNNWKNEFQIAQKLGFELIEWVVDDKNNPIFDNECINTILELSEKYEIKINSLCADYFMNNLLFKNTEELIRKNLGFLTHLIQQCKKCNIKILELPFVDSSSLKNIAEQKQILENLETIVNIAQDHDIILCLETDLEPNSFVSLLEKFNHPNIKANYDIGNSTSKNYDMNIELDILKKWIVNVHIKDRIKNGKTVPLGSGDVNFQGFFQNLKKIDYSGDLIIQGAREDFTNNVSTNQTCLKYLEFVNRYLEKDIAN